MYKILPKIVSPLDFVNTYWSLYSILIIEQATWLEWCRPTHHLLRVISIDHIFLSSQTLTSVSPDLHVNTQSYTFLIQQTWVKYIILLDSNTFFCSIDLAWCNSANQDDQKLGLSLFDSISRVPFQYTRQVQESVE